MGEPYHGRNSLIILDLRPISHPFEPYAHQYGCMFDTMRCWKIKGIRPEGITEPEPVVDAPKTTETPKKTVVPQSTTTPRPATAPKPATTSKPTKTPGPVETPSRSSSGFSSYVSVNEELAASDSAESFDMVEEPVDPESSHTMGQATSRESPTNADHELSTNSGVAHSSSFVSSANGHNTVSTASSTLDSQDLTSVVSRLSLADEPYPDPDYSISGHLAANKVIGAVGRAQHSPPHAQRSSPRREQTTPRREQATPRKSEPDRAVPTTPMQAPSPHVPRTPQVTTPDKSRRRKSKDHRRSSHTPRTPELDASPRSRQSNDQPHMPQETSPRSLQPLASPRSPQPLKSPRSPQPLADLTTDQRNIILCIQKAYHKVGPHEQWIGVYHGDIAKSHIKDDVVAQAASISNDIETLVDKGYLTTTVDEDHFDCRDHSHGRYRRYTEILADLSLDDD
ncbi:hypothetical protein K523DRAFT_251860 [Schizophyllum commune Tattone D]|nr:hypothetical protein K523DRAFT_251860 [Schizophyllum commune Tattone D]